MYSYWKEENQEKAERFNITCQLPDEPIIFYKDGTWVPVKKAKLRQLQRHLDFLHAQGFIGAQERTRAWSYPAPQGEIAYDMWEEALEQMEELPAHPLIDAIEGELKTRTK